MRFREWFHGPDDQERRNPAPEAGGGLSNLRQEGEELLAAGDAAIDRVLSGDSERFLTASRQQGGE